MAAESSGDRFPILVFISWNGSPGSEVERQLRAGHLLNVQRLIDKGIYAPRTVGNWPSATAAGHAAVSTGAYGNVNGITGNMVPRMPRSSGAVNDSVPGFSSASLLTEHLWVTAARSGRRSVIVSWAQDIPFEMSTISGYLSSQGVPSFGDFSESLLLCAPYSSPRLPARMLRGSTTGAMDDIEIVEGPGEWRNLPQADRAVYKSFLLGGQRVPTSDDQVLYGLLIAPEGTRFTKIALSGTHDYGCCEILKPAPFRNDASLVSRPYHVTMCDSPGECLTGYTHFRLTQLAVDGSSFEMWRTEVRDLRKITTDPCRLTDWLALGAAFTGYSPGLPNPFREAAELPNIHGELAFHANEYLFNTLAYEIARDEHDIYVGYSPFPIVWLHLEGGIYGEIFTENPDYDVHVAAKARRYLDQIYQNLDDHLGRVMGALDATGRAWNIVLTTDHGMEPTWRDFLPNRVLRAAGLLGVDDNGNLDLRRTLAYHAGGYGIRVNLEGRYRDGAVRAVDYGLIAERICQAFLRARDPRTGERIVAKVHRAGDHEDEGLGGPHADDLYLELQPRSGYRINQSIDEGPIVTYQLVSGTYGDRPSTHPDLQGFAVAGGDNFVSGLNVGTIRSIDLVSTAACAVGIDPAPHWRGTTWRNWFTSRLPQASP